jgi:ABC-type uncharacterized transport system fused permease/ATPase subunit
VCVESIAAYSGHEREWATIKDKFNAVYKQLHVLVHTQYMFGMIDDVCAAWAVQCVLRVSERVLLCVVVCCRVLRVYP